MTTYELICDCCDMEATLEYTTMPVYLPLQSRLDTMKIIHEQAGFISTWNEEKDRQTLVCLVCYHGGYGVAEAAP